MGRPVDDMTVAGYHAYQAQVWPIVTAALARLRATSDLVVVEGAGSSAEINLRDRDIVNMRVALHARAPVLLVGDIDRGGVFASLVGHMELFTPAERALVRGFVINKFRGDAALLDSGPRLSRGAHRRTDPRRRALPERLARRRRGLACDRRPAPPASGRAAAHRCRASALHQQLHRLRRPGRRPRRRRRVRRRAGRSAGRRRRHRAGHQEHGGRPCLAARARPGGRARAGRRRRHAGDRHLRRLPDAGSPHPRPRGSRVARRRGGRPGPARRRDDVPGGEAHGPRDGRGQRRGSGGRRHAAARV